MSYFKGVMLREYRDTVPILKLRCTTQKIGNFTYNRVYYAIGRPLGTAKPTTVWTQYQFDDDDGDTYTLDTRDLGKWFLITDRLTKRTNYER